MRGGPSIDVLLDIAHKAAAGELLVALQLTESLRDRHLTVAADLLGDAPDATEIATEMILRADRALYQAKRGGRDRLVNADDPRMGMPITPPI